jgi:integrase
MAWSELSPSGVYHVGVRLGGRKFTRSLKTEDEGAAISAVACIEENLRLIERGRLEIPNGADVLSFLLSNGKVAGPVAIQFVTLGGLFERYFAGLPEGNLEESTMETMKVHRRSLESHFGKKKNLHAIDLDAVQGYIDKRSRDRGLCGPLSPVTIRKEIVTLRTIWNWAKQRKIVHDDFPARGLKYPKGKEKPPYMPFEDVQKRTRGMEAEDAAELWEAVFLVRRELDDLLGYVERTAEHDYLYPMFVFCAHTGARRSEMARASVWDLDFQDGFVTLHERKKSRETKTTRRVPMTNLFNRALKDWTRDRSGPLFGTTAEEAFTPKALHHCFEHTLTGSKWENLRGWHVFRHSFISCLAAKGVDQRIIDELVGHCTEQQRRRYRHLLPNKIKHSVVSVFG